MTAGGQDWIKKELMFKNNRSLKGGNKMPTVTVCPECLRRESCTVANGKPNNERKCYSCSEYDNCPFDKVNPRATKFKTCKRCEEEQNAET